MRFHCIISMALQPKSNSNSQSNKLARTEWAIGTGNHSSDVWIAQTAQENTTHKFLAQSHYGTKTTARPNRHITRPTQMEFHKNLEKHKRIFANGMRHSCCMADDSLGSLQSMRLRTRKCRQKHADQTWKIHKRYAKSVRPLVWNNMRCNSRQHY